MIAVSPPISGSLSKWRLFTLFSGMALIGFGGVMPWAHRILVEKRNLLSPQEFLEILAYAQLMPGPTICNISILVGHRKAGSGGAVAALSGMVVPPAVFVLALGYAYQELAHAQVIQDVLRGMSVAAAALVAATALRMAKSLKPTWRNAVLAAAMFAGIALLHWPLALVMLGLAGLALLINPRTTQS